MLIYEKNISDFNKDFMIYTIILTLINSFVPWKTQEDKV